MRKVITLLAVLLVLRFSFQATTTFAATKSGRVGKSFSWSYDTKSKILTIRPYKKSDKKLVPSRNVYTLVNSAKKIKVNKGFKRVPWLTSMYKSYSYGQYESLSLPSGVKYIDNRAFQSCIMLEKLNMKKGVKYIGRSAFRCSSIKRLKLPQGLEYIGDGAFCNLTEDDLFETCGDGVKSVTFNNDLKVIGSGAFMSSSVKKLIVPDSVDHIGMEAFGDCHYLTKVKLPKDLRTIESGLLFNDYELDDIKIPDTVEVIEDYAFARTRITDIIIPRNVRVLGEPRVKTMDDYEDEYDYYNHVAEELANCIFDGGPGDDYSSELEERFNAPDYIDDSDPAKTDEDYDYDDEDYDYSDDEENEDYDYSDDEEDEEDQDNNGIIPVDNTGIFYKCEYLTRIRVESKKIDTVYKGAFAGLRNDVVVEVPRGLKDKYRDMFVNAGLSEKADFVEVDVDTDDTPYVRLNESNVTMKSGSKRNLELMYTDEPDMVDWTSSNVEIVSMDASHNAVALKPGEAEVTASYKGHTYSCDIKVTKDANNDARALKNLIKEQRRLGAKGIDTDIYSNQYKWKNGRLIKINWSGAELCGIINLNPFSYLTFFDYSGKGSMVWKIDAADLQHINCIGCDGSDIPHKYIRTDSARTVNVYNTPPECFEDSYYDFVEDEC